MYSEDQELSAEERAALAALPRELAPSDLLEERVVRALKNEGHLGAETRTRRTWYGNAMRAAAAIALFAGGVATGRFVLSQPSGNTTTTSAAVKQTSVNNSPPPVSNGAQSVKNNETVVAEREMWL